MKDFNIINGSSFRTFFLKLQVDADLIETYIASLSKVGVNNEGDLRGFASIWNLEKIGIHQHDVQNIMQTLFADVKAAESTMSSSNEERFLIDEDGLQSTPSYLQGRPTTIPASSRLTKNTVIIFQEIGRGASGRVSKALFAPTLTLVAIKRIEIKDAITRKVVGQELKFLYEVARSDLISTLPTESDNNTIESPKLSLLSGELYSDVIAGNHSLQSPSCTTDLEGSSNVLETVRTAKSPYIISFYDAYIDPEYGAVCLVLEYMNAGSIQNMLTEGKKFNEDDAAVVAFSVLHALIELHSRNILHRDIKPSNILADRAGHIKLTDFGITKEMLEENKCADSFIGTLAYMSPDRVRGIPYSFEADMWSLGITMITMVMGKPPFPTNRGPWNLMNAIIQGPQPTLDPGSVSPELQSFVHDCLNQSPQDSTCAAKLLDHDFLLSAKNRGVTTPSLLSRLAMPACHAETSAEVIDKIVEAAMSWQLEQYEDEKAFRFNTERYDGEAEWKEPSNMTRNLPQYSTQQIAGLASQMLIESSILQERFDAKYAQINALFIEGWSIEGLRRVVWPTKVEGEKVILNTFSEAFETDAPSENTSCPKSTNTIESDITDQMLR